MPLVSLFINLKIAVSWYSAHNRNYFYAYGFFENLTSWNVLLQIKIKCVLIYFPDHVVIIIGVSSTILAICFVVFLLLYKRVLLRRWVVPKSWIFFKQKSNLTRKFKNISWTYQGFSALIRHVMYNIWNSRSNKTNVCYARQTLITSYIATGKLNS